MARRPPGNIAVSRQHPMFTKAVACHRAEKLSEAAQLYEQLLKSQPNHVNSLTNLAMIKKQSGYYDEVIQLYNRVLAIQPDNIEILVKYGTLTQQLGRLEASVPLLEKAAWLGNKDAVITLSRSYLLLNRNVAAATILEKALMDDPAFNKAKVNLAIALWRQGRVDEAVTITREALASPETSSRNLHSNLLFIMHFSPRFSMEEIYRETLAWDEVYAKPLTPPRKEWPQKKGGPDKRLRVGFLSPDFRNHPVSYFFISFLEAVKDAHNWDAVLYADTVDADGVTERLSQASKEFYNIAAYSDTDLVEKIRADGIDILFDLCGHTARNRLLVFARKPAPVQVTWLGYSDSTGMEAMDYLLADTITIPQETEMFYRERILRMPENFLCYSPIVWAPEVAPSPILKNGYVTFASTNQLSKITKEVIALWSKVIKAVPGARLIIKTKGFADKETRERYYELFKAAGLSGESIALQGPGTHKELMEFYHTVDITLDTFPYAGGTTTCESLWMGVPVITLVGDRFFNRHSASHLWNAGMRGLIAKTEEEYIAIAKEMSADIQKLALLRQKIRPIMAKSPLTDATGFAGQFAEILRKIWQGVSETQGI